MTVTHDTQSRAHEAIPGTVDLRAQENEETHYGQALFPVPSADPNDPLQWSASRKNMILFIYATYSFLSNTALVGPTVYISVFSKQFGIDKNTAAGLVNYGSLAYGFSSLVFVPAYNKFGRRPVMLVSMFLYMAGLLAAARATTFSSLMAARVVHNFGSGVCEALPVQLVNDIFFIHERGQKLGWYTLALLLGSTGPLYAGYMLAGGFSYHLFFYVEFAFAVALFVLAFFFAEESRFKRRPAPSLTNPAAELPAPEKDATSATAEKKPGLGQEPEVNAAGVYPPRKSLSAQLKPWSGYDGEAPFFLTIVRSFSYLLVPSTLWAITTFGIGISVSGQAFGFTFPIKIVAPPYNWSQVNAGLLSISNLLGNLLALPLLPLVDRYAASRTRRNGGIREAEMRLAVLLVPMVVSPLGVVLYGLTAEYNLHWIGYFIAYCITKWGVYFYFTVVLAYAVDSYTANLSELLIIKNVGKQCIVFGVGLDVLNWILQNGYGKVIAGIFSAVLLANNMMVLVFMIWGKKIRVATNNWRWLANLHRDSVDPGSPVR